ncbi:putative tat pathway signal sequence [Zalerion maritima]|uniref:Tat pathway signal sequence n=1 Tax=Zalerion maritima TaxID=339359 RepID=A0AAD5RLW6_9PEZI|nr:putative tat pathway signal sequence [Zalerion maritima]
MPSSFRRRMLGLGLLLTIPITAINAADVPTVSEGMTIGSGTLTTVTENATPTGSYKTYTTKVDVSVKASDDEYDSSSSSTSVSSGNSTASGTDTGSSSSSSTSITYITGSNSVTTTDIVGNATSATSTSSSATATNTQPCNNYAEFCHRKYSNITEVSAHNSPFVRADNAASNQELDVTTQLNDGVRFLQAQIQYASNDTAPHFCHTSCDVLDAGPITDWLTKVKDWVSAHPYDVVTILLGNGNYTKAGEYVPYIQETGILNYIYTPPHLPMVLDDWPTLAELILSNQRVIMFMDYETDPDNYPWLMDEFSNMWETPFDPIDYSFPCTVQRPPSLSDDDAKNRLYMTNHNYNVEITAFGASILVPATSVLNQTNNVTGEGSLGEGAQSCLEDWGRPPNFLNVDYYNFGGYPGAVFEVAAKMNNVTYNRECCGSASSGAIGSAEALPLGIVLGAAVMVSWLMT